MPREGLSSLDGLTLGTLVRKGERGAILTIGNQRLDGKVVELKQPLAVMNRNNVGGECGNEENSMTDNADSSRRVEFEIVGLIRKKIVFSHR